MTLSVPDQSYVTAVQADSYFSLRGNSAWLQASDADKEAALVRASDYIDFAYKFLGQPADPNQARQWPRVVCDEWWPSLGVGCGVGPGYWFTDGLWACSLYPGLFFANSSWDNWVPGMTGGVAWTLTSTDLSVLASDQSINSLNGEFEELVPNQVVQVSGFANAANNGTFINSSENANKIVVAGQALVDEDAGASVTITAVIGIPRQIMNACCELAQRSLADPTTPLMADLDAAPVVSETVGPIETKYGLPFNNGHIQYGSVDRMVWPLTLGGSNTGIRLGRG